MLVTAPACGTDAVGVEDCRDIELARCEAGQACGIVDDVAACKRFYRDHCLHGLALADEPSARAVQACVKSIETAGGCAKSAGPDTLVPDCANLTQAATGLEKACDVVSAPEEIFECEFLAPKARPAPTPDAAAEAPSDTGDASAE